MATPAVSVPDSTTDKPPRRRRMVPLSLRMFICVQSIMGVSGVLWVGIPAYRQWNAIHALEQPNVLIGMGPGNYEWLRPWLGNEYMKMFARVEKVILEKDEITDRDLANLRALPDLKELHLHGKKITNAGLSHVEGLSDLNELFVGGEQLTEEGLKHFGKLQNLKQLHLGIQITDDGLLHLTRLENLKYLHVCSPLSKEAIANFNRSRSRTAWPVYVYGAYGDRSRNGDMR
jgi:hypothetical protein